MATTDTWSNPNYAGELFLVGKNRTPFLNAVGGLSGGGRVVNTMDFAMSSEWSLDAASQPAITETASLTAPANNNYTRGQELNTCQIYHESVYVSYVKQSTPGAILTDLSNGLSAGGTNQVQSEVDFQIMANLRQIAFNAEYTFLNGTYQQATAANVAAKTKGLIEYMTTNSGIASGDGGDLAKADVNTLLISMVDNGAPLDQPVIWVNSYQKTSITSLYEVQPRDWYVGGGSVDSVITDFATMPVMYSPAVPTNKLIIADMAHIKPVFCPVPGKGILFYEELARTGAGIKGQIYGQIGVDFGPEEYHGEIEIPKTS